MDHTRIPPPCSALIDAARRVGEDATAALDLAVDVGASLPLPGQGDTSSRWSTLGAVARVGLTAARVLEAHCDAVAILAEAGEERPAGSWGVFAAEAPGVRVDAHTRADGTLGLTGTKPWCSLGGVLDHALITAHVGSRRQLFRVDLRQPGVRAMPAAQWVSRGLRAVPSVPVVLDDATAYAVGEPGWYLERAGFAWGGIGVAACWFGGTLGLADTVRRHAARRPGPLTDLHVGRIDVALHSARAVLDDAAARVDAGLADGPAGTRLALRVRAVVADAAEEVLRCAGHALGPAPLAFDAEHAARVADLTVYVRQHHGERDLAALGAELLSDEPDQGRSV